MSFSEYVWRIDDPDLNNIIVDRTFFPDAEDLNETLYYKFRPIKALYYPVSISDVKDLDPTFNMVKVEYPNGIDNLYNLFTIIYSFYQQINPITGRKIIDDLGLFIVFNGIHGKYTSRSYPFFDEYEISLKHLSFFVS